jgi:hypothetical protein
MSVTFTDDDVPLLPTPAPDAPAPTDASIEYVSFDPSKIRLFRRDTGRCDRPGDGR